MKWVRILNYRNDPKFSDRLACDNSVDPDKTAPRGSTLFAIPSASFGCITVWKSHISQILGVLCQYLSHGWYIFCSVCREGIIEPSCIGEDGRPVPVSHILQLAENIPDPPQENDDDWTGHSWFLEWCWTSPILLKRDFFSLDLDKSICLKKWVMDLLKSTKISKWTVSYKTCLDESKYFQSVFSINKYTEETIGYILLVVYTLHSCELNFSCWQLYVGPFERLVWS